jgi:hypothetical protein
MIVSNGMAVALVSTLEQTNASSPYDQRGGTEKLMWNCHTF